jgi:hypothetical protein
VFSLDTHILSYGINNTPAFDFGFANSPLQAFRERKKKKSEARLGVNV